jgi:hypothetical protein
MDHADTWRQGRIARLLASHHTIAVDKFAVTTTHNWSIRDRCWSGYARDLAAFPDHLIWVTGNRTGPHLFCVELLLQLLHCNGVCRCADNQKPDQRERCRTGRGKGDHSNVLPLAWRKNFTGEFGSRCEVLHTTSLPSRVPCAPAHVVVGEHHNAQAGRLQGGVRQRGAARSCRLDGTGPFQDQHRLDGAVRIRTLAPAN